ncbi:hypothetical protein TD95_001295, partial [Thielaviopsis punctulata]
MDEAVTATATAAAAAVTRAAPEHASFTTQVIDQLKEWVQDAFDQWSLTSSLLTIFLFGLLLAGTIWAYESELHPMQLARQSMRSEMRHPGQSAIYRAAAQGFNGLVKGLNVVEDGAPKFSHGRDGDLRDVWRKFAKGNDKGEKSVITTVLGLEKKVTHDVDSLTRQIALIGDHIAKNGGIRVAVYLPNSIELLLTVFACAFYPNLTVILIPYEVPPTELVSMLHRSAADTVVTAPGVFPLDTISESYSALRQLIWVVDEGTSSMDWHVAPTGTVSGINVATWANIVKPSVVAPELSTDTATAPGDLVFFWSSEEISRFTQANIIAGMAAQIASTPSSEIFSSKDTFVPAQVLTDQFTLTVTLVALFNNANIVLNSVAGKDANLSIATQGVPATVIVAAPEQALVYHNEGAASISGSIIMKWVHNYRLRLLENYGVFPHIKGFLAELETANAPDIGQAPTVPRVLYIAEKVDRKPLMTSQMLSDIRALTSARVVHAMTSSKVAGSVAQTLWYDYRLMEGATAHFGPPAPSVELWLTDKDKFVTKDFIVEGEINVKGASVIGGHATLEAIGKINEDTT